MNTNERIDSLKSSNPALYDAFYHRPLVSDAVRDIPVQLILYMPTTVVNVKVKYLRPQYQSLQDWLDKGDGQHVYVGRNMEFYVPGAKASKWNNPYAVKKYGRDVSLEMYRVYIETHPTLKDELHELKGKVLGCWCYPEACHASILADMCDNDKSDI